MNVHHRRIRPEPPAEALEDLGRGSSQDVRVLEALAEQGEVRIEPKGGRDEHDPGSDL